MDGVADGRSAQIALVTGAAGFIGSHLCELLLDEGQHVRGVDALTDYYPPLRKAENLAPFLGHDRFEFMEGDLADTSLATVLEGVDTVYHLAAQPGVRASWGSEFHEYVQRNVVATQRLLEACRERPLNKFIYASSSSVYGDAETHPTRETVTPRPISPYGVTKLAGEQLCELYRHAHAVPTTSLRLFTVYGPRQRPDMALSRLVACAVSGGAFELYGDGEQTRDVTFIGDVVAAMRAAAQSPWCGVANVGTGVPVSMNSLVAKLTALAGPLRIERRPASAGDARHTSADIGLAQAAFGYRPRASVDEGLAAMIAWEQSAQAVMV